MPGGEVGDQDWVRVEEVRRKMTDRRDIPMESHRWLQFATGTRERKGPETPWLVDVGVGLSPRQRKLQGT